MSRQELGIERKQLPETLVATARFCVQQRSELPAIWAELAESIPPEIVAGPPFCIFWFVTSVKDGNDAEVGFPVTRPFEAGAIQTRTLPALEVLSLVHRGPAEGLGQVYRLLYGYASSHGLISDEFCREVYLEDGGVELQLVVHRWNDLLADNLARVVGAEARRAVMQGAEALTVDSSVDERFEWLKGAMERLEGLADEYQRYDVISSCAHVFPATQLDKLHAVYEQARADGCDGLAAVDAVIAFMEQDPGWGETSRREGRLIYAAKKPRDPQAYENATTDAERRQAYCFCPLVRSRLDDGMPVSFCYCGSGWYRQQWERATGRPVTVEVLKSVMRGDERCEFAVHLPDDL